ncbi:MAG: hypothetical protein M3Z36_09380, partial [Acidobacteriota bacterium]|nr:hypothetical protein [Acidobacteriota bacterium]
MATTEETLRSIAAIPNVQISRDVPLARYTRFAIGGPADAVVETASADSFITALNVVRGSGLPYV